MNLDIKAGTLPQSQAFHFSTISRHPALFELNDNFILRVAKINLRHISQLYYNGRCFSEVFSTSV